VGTAKYSSEASPQTDELAKKVIYERIEKPNGLEQLGSSIRWKKLALFVKNFGHQNSQLGWAFFVTFLYATGLRPNLHGYHPA
jgi:hypothetical protein